MSDRWRYFAAGMVAGAALVVGLGAFLAAWIAKRRRGVVTLGRAQDSLRL